MYVLVKTCGRHIELIAGYLGQPVVRLRSVRRRDDVNAPNRTGAVSRNLGMTKHNSMFEFRQFISTVHWASIPLPHRSATAIVKEILRRHGWLINRPQDTTAPTISNTPIAAEAKCMRQVQVRGRRKKRDLRENQEQRQRADHLQCVAKPP